MLMKIVPRHLNEINQYYFLDYLCFKEKLVEVFKEPDLATAYLNALASLLQTRDESISDYMHCARLLVIKAHPDLAHAPRAHSHYEFSSKAVRSLARLFPRRREDTDCCRRRAAGC